MIMFPEIDKPLVVYRLYCMALYHFPDATSYDNLVLSIAFVKKNRTDCNNLCDFFIIFFTDY